MLSPLSFLKDPIVWLRAISKYRAFLTSSPDFGLQLTVRRLEERLRTATGQRDLQDMDLSSLSGISTRTRELACVVIETTPVASVIPCGGEPVKPKSLLMFSRALKGYGLRSDAVFAGYGQAEHVAGICDFRVDASSRDAMQLSADDSPVPGLVPNGRPPIASEEDMDTVDIRIVDPESSVEVDLNTIGEIWVHSPSKSTRGYWNNPTQTEITFGARIVQNSGQRSIKRYLRTGDLGFLDKDRRLYICGRQKDIIIIRGANVYPQDIEEEVQALSSHIRPGCIAVFRTTGSSSTSSGDIAEGVDVVAEVRDVNLSMRDFDDISDDIFRSIAVNHPGVQVFKVCFISPKSVPKTSSGKIQRSKARALLMSASLEIVYQKQRTAVEDDQSQSEALLVAEYKAELNETTVPSSLNEVYNMLGLMLLLAGGKSDLALLADIRRGADSCRGVRVVSLGLDSLSVVTLSQLLADYMRVDLAPKHIYESGTVEALVIRIGKALQIAEAEIGPTSHVRDLSVGSIPRPPDGKDVPIPLANISIAQIVGFEAFQVISLFVVLWLLFALWTPCYWMLEHFFDQNQFAVLAQTFRLALAPRWFEATVSVFKYKKSYDDPFCIPYRDIPTEEPYFANVYWGVSIGMAVTLHVFALLVATSAVLLKWLLVQRVTVGSYSLWGLQHARVWLASLFVGTAGYILSFFFPDSVILVLWYRLLGVRVAWTADLEGHFSLALGVWDVVSIGEGSTVSTSAALEAASISRGSVHVRAIQIGSQCDVGDAAIILGGSRVSHGSVISPLTVCGGGYWREPHNSSSYLYLEHDWSGWDICWSLTKAVCWLVVNCGTIVACFMPVVWVGRQFQDIALGPFSRLMSLFLLVVVFLSSWLIIVVLFKRLLSYHSLQEPNASKSLDGSAQLRRVMFNRLHAVVTSHVLRYFAITGINTFWYWLLGANISPTAIFSAAVHFEDPEVVTVGSYSILGGGASMKTARSSAGELMLQATTLGNHAFVSQKTVIGPGCHLLDHARVLPLTHVPPTTVLSPWSVTSGYNSTYRSQVPDVVGYAPQHGGWNLFGTMLVQQVAGCLWMIGIQIFAAVSVITVLYELECNEVMGSLQWPIATTVGVLVCLVGLILTKWVLLWKATAGVDIVGQPFGRTWAWTVVFSTYNVFTTYFGDIMLGGPLMNLFLSLMGTRVSQSAFVASAYIYDWDLVTIGPSAIIKPGATLSPHIIDNSREIVFAPVVVGSGCEVGINSLVLGGTTLSSGAVLAPSSRTSPMCAYDQPRRYSGGPATISMQEHEHLQPPHFDVHLENDSGSIQNKNYLDESDPRVYLL